MTMPDSDAKRKWMEENSIVFSVKIMRRTEADLVEFFEKRMAQGERRGTIVKTALREYMKNHPET